MNAWMLYWLLTKDKSRDVDFDYLSEGDVTFMLVIWIIVCVAIIGLDIWMFIPVIKKWLA
jgi:hypothetical protein